MIVIKKYSNRRLYDTDESRYITLEELADRIRGGAEVRVLDAKTNADLTQQTMAQIILESRGASRLLPVPLLAQLIRMQDEHLAEFFSGYMTWALEMYLRAKQGVAQLAPFNPFSQVPMNASSLMARMFGGFGVDPMSAMPQIDVRPPPPVEPDPIEPERSDKDDIASLRQELAELKQALLAGTRGESPGKKS